MSDWPSYYQGASTAARSEHFWSQQQQHHYNTPTPTYYQRSSQNGWVHGQSGQSSNGTFSWNQQNNQQYQEATTSHYPYNYPSNNNRSQQHYSNTYNFHQQQGEGTRYSYQQSYYSYGYQCPNTPNGDSRSSGASFATNNGNHQESCHNGQEDKREQANNSNEQKKRVDWDGLVDDVFKEEFGKMLNKT